MNPTRPQVIDPMDPTPAAELVILVGLLQLGHELFHIHLLVPGCSLQGRSRWSGSTNVLRSATVAQSSRRSALKAADVISIPSHHRGNLLLVLKPYQHPPPSAAAHLAISVETTVRPRSFSSASPLRFTKLFTWHVFSAPVISPAVEPASFY